ncbi:hypothetical protein FOZ63_027922, partial [Perkinsus olseni]
YVVPVARDYVWPFLVGTVWPLVEKLPLDLRVALLWIFGVLMLRKFYPKAKHLTILPIAWFIWRGYYYLLPEKYVRVPLIVCGTVLPLLASLRIYFSTSSDSSKVSQDQRASLRSYLCYWALFPVMLAADYTFVTFLTTLADHDAATRVNYSYNAGCLVLLIWLVGYGGIVAAFEFARRVLWTLMGQQMWVLCSAGSKYLKEKVDEHGALWKIGLYWSKFQRIITANSRTVGFVYKIGVIALAVVLLLYYAYSVLMRLFAFAVWPWYMVETGKTVSRKAYWDYRPCLAFSLLFLSTELLVAPRLIFPFSALFNMAHMPIVFGLKYFGEFILDSCGKFYVLMSAKLVPSAVEKRQGSKVSKPKKRFGGVESAQTTSGLQERIKTMNPENTEEVELQQKEGTASPADPGAESSAAVVEGDGMSDEKMQAGENSGGSTAGRNSADEVTNIVKRGPRRSSRLSSVRQRASASGSRSPSVD